MTEKVFTRQCPTYDWAKIILVVTDNVLESSRKRGVDVKAQARMIPNYDKNCVTVILQWSATAGTVAHEAIHAAVWVLDMSGVPLAVTTDEGQTVTVIDEPLAYLVDNLVNWFADKIVNKAPLKYKRRKKRRRRG